MKSLTAKTLGVAMLCALAVAGCERENKSKAEEQPTVTPITTTSLSCDDASIKNALVQELTGVVEKQIAGQIGDFANSEALDLETKVKARLPEIAVDLQNVREEAGVCKTDLVITMPMSDVGYANRHFRAQGEPSVGEQAESLGIKFNDNSFSADVSYRIENGDIKLESVPEMLGVVAGATSAATYAIAKSGADNKTATRPANNSSNARPVAPAPAAVVRPRPAKPADTTHNPKPPKPASETPKPKAQPKANTSGSEGNASASSSAPQETVKDTPRATRSEPKTQQQAQPAPKEEVKNTAGEITVVETDDTY